MQLPSKLLMQISGFEKAMRINMKYFLKTHDNMFRQNYLYYENEKQGLIQAYFENRLSDKDYLKLNLY